MGAKVAKKTYKTASPRAGDQPVAASASDVATATAPAPAPAVAPAPAPAPAPTPAPAPAAASTSSAKVSDDPDNDTTWVKLPAGQVSSELMELSPFDRSTQGRAVPMIWYYRDTLDKDVLCESLRKVLGAYPGERLVAWLEFLTCLINNGIKRCY